MKGQEKETTLTSSYHERVTRLFEKCRGIDEKMRKEGKRPIVTDTLKGFIPSENIGSNNIEQAMEYIADLENEIDSLISHFETGENAG